MSLARFWSSFKLLNLSKPVGDRSLYRAVRGLRVESILEVNVGNANRSEKLIAWLREQSDVETIRYAAIDAFEMGGDDHISLKEFHSRLGRLGTKPLPVPDTGKLSTALARVAHTIGSVDLAIFDCEPQRLEEPTVLAILPKIIRTNSIVLTSSGEMLALATDQQRSSLLVRKVA